VRSSKDMNLLLINAALCVLGRTGMEKFMNIKCRYSGRTPSAAIVVATVRQNAARTHTPRARARSFFRLLAQLPTWTDD